MYIRLTGGAPLKKIHNENFKFKIGEPERIRKGKRLYCFHLELF